jgi:1-acyl-sn-glycerol-3-phosphate acyltransferase
VTKKQNYIPRLLATGICFFTFFLVGTLLTLILVPLSLILPLGKRRRRRLGLALVRRSFSTFFGYCRAWRLTRKVEIVGREHLKPHTPSLIILNHPTLVDVVAVLGMVPKCNCMVKKALFNTVAMGGVLRAAGLIPNDAGTAFIDRARECFEEGYSLMIFPEGTRSPRLGLNKFSRGAAQVALRTGVPVIKVLVTCHPPTLMKGQKWYQIPDRPVDFRIEFFPPEQVEPAAEDGDLPMKVRELTRQWESFYRGQLEKHLWHLG